MYKGLALQDGSGSQTAGLGGRVNEGNASEQFALTYFGGSGISGNTIVRKLDPLTMRGQGRPGRGYAMTARGRTWDFICRVSQSGGG